MQADSRGFSLIELLIVVAIILIIVAIAIPSFLRSRIAANQASAIQSCRALNSAEITFFSTYAQGYSSTLLALAPPSSGQPTPSAAALIDTVLAAGFKSGYSLTYTPNTPDANGNYQGYTLTPNPITPGLTGNAYYFADQTYVIRSNAFATASASDSPISQ